MPEIPSSTPGDRITRAVTTPDRGRVPRGVRAPLPPITAPRGADHRLAKAAARIGLVVTVGGAAVGGAWVATHQGGGTPDQTPLPGGIVEPSRSPNPTPISTENPTVTLPPSAPSPTPEITPPPDLTFPGDLQSFVNHQIYAENLFFGNAGIPGRLELNFLGNELMHDNIETYGQFQGLELGAEVVDGHLINYFGVKDGMGNQYFFGVNYGGINSSDKVLLDHPRSSLNDPKAKQGQLVTVNRAEQALKENIENEIIFGIFSFQNLQGSGGTINFEELRQQNPIALKLLEWSLKAKGGDYRKIPMDPQLKELINQRITHFDPTLVPGAYQITPFQKP